MMPSRVEIHPTAKIAFRTLAYAIAIALVLLGLKRLTRSDAQINTGTSLTKSEASETNSSDQRGNELVFSTSRGVPLAPVIDLEIPDASLESGWSAALATLLAGQTEVAIEGGRIDVLTEHYAIEVDRLEKWHEAIGQSTHYALKTKKIPVAALIIPSDNWPLSSKTRAKLVLIDETCTSKGIKLILLRRLSATT